MTVKNSIPDETMIRVSNESLEKYLDIRLWVLIIWLLHYSPKNHLINTETKNYLLHDREWKFSPFFSVLNNNFILDLLWSVWRQHGGCFTI